MSELNDLYQELILEHNAKPRNFGALEAATHRADGFNPLCGDQLHLFLQIQDGIVVEARFKGSGCAIFKASASVMTTLIKGKPVAAAETLFHDFHAAVTGTAPASDLGKLNAFLGVREFPARVKCATLAWHTLDAALHGKDIASTE